MAAFFLMLLTFLTACAWETVETLIYIKLPWLEHHRLAGSIIHALDVVELCALLAFVPLLLGTAVFALCGSVWSVPLLTQLTRRRWSVRISFVLNSFVVTFNRFSTLWDHAVWFAFTGPSEMKKVK